MNAKIIKNAKKKCQKNAMAKCTEIMPSYAWEMTFFGWIVQMAKSLPEKTFKNQGLRFKLLFCWEIAFSYVDEC